MFALFCASAARRRAAASAVCHAAMRAPSRCATLLQIQGATSPARLLSAVECCLRRAQPRRYAHERRLFLPREACAIAIPFRLCAFL